MGLDSINQPSPETRTINGIDCIVFRCHDGYNRIVAMTDAVPEEDQANWVTHTGDGSRDTIHHANLTGARQWAKKVGAELPTSSDMLAIKKLCDESWGNVRDILELKPHGSTISGRLIDSGEESCMWLGDEGMIHLSIPIGTVTRECISATQDILRFSVRVLFRERANM